MYKFKSFVKKASLGDEVAGGGGGGRGAATSSILSKSISEASDHPETPKSIGRWPWSTHRP